MFGRCMGVRTTHLYYVIGHPSFLDIYLNPEYWIPIYEEHVGHPAILLRLALYQQLPPY